MRFVIIAIMCKLCVRIILANNIRKLMHCHPHSQRSYGVRTVNFTKKNLDGMEQSTRFAAFRHLIIQSDLQIIFAVMQKGEPMSKSMYAQGRRIESISDFDQCESLWYKWNGRTTHRSVLISLQYRTLLNSIIAGRIYVAERRTDERSNQQTGGD